MGDQSTLERDTVLSGGAGMTTTSTRAGYLPVSLEYTPAAAFKGIAIYRRADADSGTFSLYRAASYQFKSEDRQRLLQLDERYVFVRMDDHNRMRRQIDAHIDDVVADPKVATAEKAALLYETSVALVDELLSEPHLAKHAPRVEKMSRTITSLVLKDESAFSHLYAVSHHDFYTATHMVNVATWMVPLACAMGYDDQDELSRICQAGILHDVGKINIPEAILNKKGKLTDEEWVAIKRHPEDGYQQLKSENITDPIILAVTREHHEREDGTGYPHGLTGEQMHPVSKICAVVDSFDAMTAFRPFKDRTMTVADAMEILQRESSTKYDAHVMESWQNMLHGAVPGDVAAPQAAASPSGQPQGPQRRDFERYTMQSPARLHVLERDGQTWREGPAIPVTTHNISRSGVGILSEHAIDVGVIVRVHVLKGGVPSRTLEGYTVRIRRYSDGVFDVGICFKEISS